MLKNTQEEKFRKFMRGTILIKGWNARSDEILKSTAEKDRNEIAAILSRLGEKIGREWARDPDVRRIDTSMLQHWGKELSEARESGPDQLAERIRNLDRKVGEILSS